MILSIGIHPPPGNGPGGHSGNTRRGQCPLDAAYHLAHGYPGGVAALAVRMGINANTLKHKLNPNNQTHHLSLREALDMQALSGNHAILHAMADALGEVCTPAMPSAPGTDPLGCLVALQVALADFSRALADPLTRGPAARGQAVTKTEMRRAQAMAQDATAAIGHALAMLRSHMRTPPKLWHE